MPAFALPPASQDKQCLTVLLLKNASCEPLLYKELISKGLDPTLSNEFV